MIRGALRGAAVVVLLVALSCHEATAPAPLVACRLIARWVQPDGSVARISSCYDVCPADAEAYAAAHSMDFTRVAACR